MWWYVLFGLGLLAGCGLAFRGWRGRRLDDHPLCRTCRYDLSGTSALPERCPECGRALGGKKPIRIGNRRRSPTLVVLGVASVVGSGAAIGLRAERDLRNVDWMAVKPVWWLTLEARHGGLLTADDALKELWKRWNVGVLTESQMASLVELALTMQADRTTKWNSRWGDLIYLALEDGRLAPEQLQRFLRHAPGLQLAEVRRVRTGGIMPLRMSYDQRVGGTIRRTWQSVDQRAWLESLRLGDMTLYEVLETSPRWRVVGEISIPGVGYGVRIKQPPGEYELAARFRVRAKHYPNGRPSFPIGFDPPYEEWTEEIRWRVTVVAADQPLVTPTRDANLASTMQRAITIGPLTQGLQARRPSLRGTLNVTDAPTNFAFRAWLRAGDREWPMSTIIIHQGKTEPLNLAAFNLDDLPEDVRSVDIVLKPDLYTADASFEPGSPVLDVEILIPGVPVKSGEATTGFVPTGGR